ncbi:glycosyltransferase family 4 protein [Enterocloster bolteae]|uniref:glycosyltransferase family 4 protein n=1 Tax=Enterocloster bolteae TaxID=208479 RepID=UPI00210CD998|nr:glycosyltransferase family 4 protein [Enterocloster bolteae]MCQ5146251.1 glycosyltransferase family 4 protein [Enterocloster bolteae]
MKVLLLNQVPEVNNKYTFSLARGLKNNGIEICVCGIKGDDVSAYIDIEFIGLFECYSKINCLTKKIQSYKKSWERVVHYCRTQKVDIVHMQWYVFSPLDWKFHKILKQCGIKVVATIHDLLPFDKKIYDYYYYKKIYTHSDRIISQAKMNEQKLIRDFRVNKDNIVYIPHGHYMEYAESVTKEESLKYLGLPEDRPIILFFGQIKKVKGVGILITAMRDVATRYPKALCVIAGKVWHDDFSVYQQLIDEYSLNDNIKTDIRFINDNEIKYYFNAADIVALPYLQIYQSGVLLLAYAYEKPIVATTEGEFLTVVRNNETGLLIPAGNSEKLAEALIWYLEHPEDGIRYAITGKADIKNRLGWDNIAKQIICEYEKLVCN